MRSAEGAFSSRVKSFCASIDTWANCCASMPKSAVTAAVTCRMPETGSSGSRTSSALAATVV